MFPSAVPALTFRDPSPPRRRRDEERRHTSRAARDVVYLRRVRLPLGGSAGSAVMAAAAPLDDDSARDAIQPSEHAEVEKWVANAIEAYFG